MNSDTIVKALLTEMFKRVGLEFDIEFCKQEDWFKKYTWTIAEEMDFIDWGVSFFVKKTKCTKTYARKQLGWFLLGYGWMIKE